MLLLLHLPLLSKEGSGFVTLLPRLSGQSSFFPTGDENMSSMNTGYSTSCSLSSNSSSSRIHRYSSRTRRRMQQQQQQKQQHDHHRHHHNGAKHQAATTTATKLYTKLLYILAAWSVFMFLVIRSRSHVVVWEEAHGGAAKALEAFVLSADERVAAATAAAAPFSNITFPILNVGLPGSGMEAMYHYFNCSGLRTQHGCCCGDLTFQWPCQMNSLHMCMLGNRRAENKSRPLLQGCDGKRQMAGPYDVFTEFSGTYRQDGPDWNTHSMFLPQHYHLEDLHLYAPNATWILPVMDDMIWTSQTHYQKKWRRRFLNEYERNQLFLATSNSSSSSSGIIPNRTEVSEIRFLHEFYNNHTRDVVEFCRLHPTHRLVIVNLSATTTHGAAAAAASESAGRVMENTFGVSADLCWQDPLEDLYVNHIHDIVKHTVETKNDKDEPRGGVQIPKLQLPLPVIVVGFPKSGTTSVWSFFRCAGVVAQHYCCCGDVSDRPPCYTHTFSECMLDNIGHNRSSSMQGCGDYPVYAQLDGERSYFDKVLRKQPQPFLSHYLPQHFELDEIHNFAPAATYVLPLRDPMAWAESVNHWFNMQVRVSNEYRWYNDSLVTNLLPRDQKKDIARLPEAQALELLAKLYQDHTEKVRSFVRQHPSHALVEFNITQHVLDKSWPMHLGYRQAVGCVTKSLSLKCVHFPSQSRHLILSSHSALYTT
jgi:hypothetical protein